ENPSGMDALMRIQTEHAIKEADRLVFIADARAGLTPQDMLFARELRRSGKPVFLAVNKAEGMDAAIAAADFHSLGLGDPHAIAATHGYGCEELMDIVLEGFPPAPPEDQEPEDGRIRIAVIGRPNVGKSTLINRLIGEERLITSDVAGTTRDSILVPFDRDGRGFTLIDTAGVRRRARVDAGNEPLPSPEKRARSAAAPGSTPRASSCPSRRRCRPSPRRTWSRWWSTRRTPSANRTRVCSAWR